MIREIEDVFVKAEDGIERILVCITAQCNSKRLINEGAKVADQVNGELHIIHVQRGDSIFNNADDNDNSNIKNKDEGKLTLRKEELDINKIKAQKGEVELSKEIVEEQKTVDVPVTHEEVVIERRTLNNEASDEPISGEETIRIPVSEEQVTVDKHTVVTGEVVAHKREVQETRRVDENLKREEARINTNGDANIVDNGTGNGLQ
ncbi:hypothetical protein SDC9_95857 [bioreactor metagenome]|uniref:DUF2382 domain-containing protein n=1 Tax=bioreactor metagenome TaxID=1076179 RepID=A0A645A7G9_9ZZZZ